MFLALFVVFFVCWIAGLAAVSRRWWPDPRVAGGRRDFVSLPLRPRAQRRVTSGARFRMTGALRIVPFPHESYLVNCVMEHNEATKEAGTPLIDCLVHDRVDR